MEQVKDVQIDLYVEEDLDPVHQLITKDYVDGIVDRMAEVNPDWDDLPSIKKIWNTDAIKHLCDHLRHQKRDQCVPLKKKIEARKKAKQTAKTSDRVPIADHEEDKQPESSQTGSFLGKRSLKQVVDPPIVNS